jgi:hypothetical protein
MKAPARPCPGRDALARAISMPHAIAMQQAFGSPSDCRSSFESEFALYELLE